MSAFHACPSELALERLARGRMVPDEAAATRDHVLGCTACVGTLEPQFRPLVEALAAYGAGLSPADEEVAEMLLSRLGEPAPDPCVLKGFADS